MKGVLCCSIGCIHNTHEKDEVSGSCDCKNMLVITSMHYCASFYVKEGNNEIL